MYVCMYVCVYIYTYIYATLATCESIQKKPYIHYVRYIHREIDASLSYTGAQTLYTGIYTEK